MGSAVEEDRMEDRTSSREYIESARASLAALSARYEQVDRICDRLTEVLESGRKIMTCGNGGSAAEAMHLSEEMVGRYRRDRRPLAAVCLNADPAAITCIANDWEYTEVFARQLQGLGQAGDAVVVLSTSGKSPSILRALERARSLEIVTIGFLGPAGSPAEALCDAAVTVEGSMPSSHVQEMHIVVIHALLERFDAVFG